MEKSFFDQLKKSRVGKVARFVTLSLGLLAAEHAGAEEPPLRDMATEVVNERKDILKVLDQIMEQQRTGTKRSEEISIKLDRVLDEKTRLEKRKTKTLADKAKIAALDEEIIFLSKKQDEIMGEGEKRREVLESIKGHVREWGKSPDAKEIFLKIAEKEGQAFFIDHQFLETVRNKSYAQEVFSAATQDALISASPEDKLMDAVNAMYFDLSEKDIPEWAKKIALESLLKKVEGRSGSGEFRPWVIRMTKSVLEKIGPKMAEQVMKDHPLIRDLASRNLRGIK